SYTGEDVAEIHCHGGPLVARAVLAAALGAGARGAERGEFTLRAFLNGKLDLAQAESVADLVAARTPAAMRAAGAHLRGELSKRVEAFRQELVAVAARLEVAIDFSEEDVGELDRVALRSELDAIGGRICSLAATYAAGRILREGARVAIVGKPNVGKSSLLNRLLGADRAIVTATPGTTRDVIEETMDLGGLPVVLSDTAGVRESVDEVERLGIERTERAIALADLAIVVLDGSRVLDDEDRAVLDATQQIRRILLINKKDLPSRLSPKELSDLAPEAPPAEASAATGEGLPTLLERLRAALVGEGAEVGGIVVTRERHFSALEAAATSVVRAAGAVDAGHPPDIVAVDVMAALDHLGEIVGRTSPEAVLDRIFSEFCIGK
ncbi:MAG: tRNA uridine-5-carboxymethylaminomethyl(34) synthesis GTPase MnmE, partial [Candidatus Binatia bacterium]